MKAVIKSRNQREGKFVPGWCYNPAFKRTDAGKVFPKKRAGAHYELRKVIGYTDIVGNFIPGLTYFRTYREGAFE
jgi:hypothetical protein